MSPWPLDAQHWPVFLSRGAVKWECEGKFGLSDVQEMCLGQAGCWFAPPRDNSTFSTSTERKITLIFGRSSEPTVTFL